VASRNRHLLPLFAHAAATQMRSASARQPPARVELSRIERLARPIIRVVIYSAQDALAAPRLRSRVRCRPNCDPPLVHRSDRRRIPRFARHRTPRRRPPPQRRNCQQLCLLLLRATCRVGLMNGAVAAQRNCARRVGDVDVGLCAPADVCGGGGQCVVPSLLKHKGRGAGPFCTNPAAAATLLTQQHGACYAVQSISRLISRVGRKVIAATRRF
jgi:hypothetical protein